jgi:hypothetical protein
MIRTYLTGYLFKEVVMENVIEIKNKKWHWYGGMLYVHVPLTPTEVVHLFDDVNLVLDLDTRLVPDGE